MLRKGLIALAVGAALLLGACENPQVNNVVDEPLGAPPGVTLDQVRQAIMYAGAKRGWQMRPEGPGKILASHDRQGHAATVEILYNTTTFSISYADSQNLQYDNGTVHPTYNRWVTFLEQDIQSYASALTPADASGTGTTPAAPPTAETTPTTPAPEQAAPAPGSSM